MEGLRKEEDAVSERARLQGPLSVPSVRSRDALRSGVPCHVVAAAAALTLAGAPENARADDQVDAEELFDRGRKLMENRTTLAEGCHALEESLRQMNRGDTMLNLAECHRRQGKTASAWAEFDKAMAIGAKVGFPEAVQTAERLRDALAAKLSKLTVTIPPATAALAGLTVELNRKPLPRERWNTVLALDPGSIHVSARAKGHKPFDVVAELGADGDARSVVVVLEVEPPLPPPWPPLRPRPSAKRSLPLWPKVVGAAGASLGLSGIGFELVSLQAHAELDAKCGPQRQSCPRGYDFAPVHARELRSFGLFVGLGTTGLLALGAAGVGLGLSLRTAGPSVSMVLSPTSLSLWSAF
jgi:hypothetical protein